MTRNEFTANDYLTAAAAERARWAAVLAPVSRSVSQRRAARKSILAHLLGL